MSILTQSVGSMLDHYADVIEGGNAYAGGTAQKGIAGTQSHDALDGATITEQFGGSSTIVRDSSLTADMKLVRESTAPLFLLGVTGTFADNVGAARKITGFSGTTITCSPAWPAANEFNDTYTIRQGFKRAPITLDMEGDEQDDILNSHDRVFQLRLGAGAKLPWRGNNIETYQADLEIRVVFSKKARHRKAIDSALENALYIRSIITRGDLRDPTYAQYLDGHAGEPTIEVDDDHKVIVLDSIPLIYRVNSAYL